MASISPHKSGFRAQIFLLGERESRVFRTKREASAWASARETEIRTRSKLPADERYTIGELLDKYLDEVVPTHKGHVREAAAVKAIKRNLSEAKMVGLPISKGEQVFADYRDRRLELVAGSTVLREIKILGVAFEAAKTEWKWISENPIRLLKKPSGNPHRDRTITWSEIRAMLREMGYPRRFNTTAQIFLLALRTGMRAGEMCNLTWSRVSEKSVYLDDTKTNSRHVPLSKKARRILAMARGNDKNSVFRIKPMTLSGLFIRYRKRSGMEGFTFHDTRHTAATWMAKKVDVLTLCKIFGWTDPKMAMVYYNPKAADIADLL